MNYSEPKSRMTQSAVEVRRRFSPRVLLAGVAVLLVAGLVFYRMAGDEGGFAGGAGPGAGGRGGFGGGFGGVAPPVRVATAETRDIPILVHTIGTVLANATVAVKSQIEGPLLSVHFE